MKCQYHPESEVVGQCQICSRSFCADCLSNIQGSHFCTGCRARPDFMEISGIGQAGCRPGVAFILGLIPGVGAICNGEYIKAIVHVVIFGFLISIQSSTHLGPFGPLFGMFIEVFYFYMPVEAYQTARRRLLEAHGLDVPPSPLVAGAGNLWAGIILTAMGIIFLLNTIRHDLLEQILRFWPMVLIGFGVFALWKHFNEQGVGKEER
jgi:hypothetical protein